MQSAEATLSITSFTSMATKVLVTINPRPGALSDTHQDIEQVKSIFSITEQSCSRFLESSDLSKVNSAPESWHEISSSAYNAIKDAYKAYVETEGLFDPRILSDLVRLGYQSSWTKEIPNTHSSESVFQRSSLNTWNPHFKDPNHVQVGDLPIDLGGIGKGLALRWSAAAICDSQKDFLIDAGGDCTCSGSAPEMFGWNIGVQNPIDIEGQPIAVLNLSNTSVCTSSVAVRKWWRNGEHKHHLISPKTGEPGGKGLSSVTVSLTDPAQAEIWSKSLFLMGRESIREFSESRQIPAMWICDNGEVGINVLMEPHLVWVNSES